MVQEKTEEAGVSIVQHRPLYMDQAKVEAEEVSLNMECQDSEGGQNMSSPLEEKRPKTIYKERSPDKWTEELEPYQNLKINGTKELLEQEQKEEASKTQNNAQWEWTNTEEDRLDHSTECKSSGSKSTSSTDRRTRKRVGYKLHAERMFTCSICGTSFNRTSTLITHMRIHTGEKPYECIVCGKSFCQSSSMNKHKRKHTGEKPFACTVCGKSFNTSSLLTRHNRMHTGEKLYACTVCGKSFTRTSAVITHMRLHTGEKPYTCTVCGKRFTKSSNLVTHKRIHSGEKLYECTVCGKHFTDSSNFTKHKRIHTVKKPNKCTLCGKRSVDSNPDQTQEKIHRGETGCIYCM